MRNFLVSPMEGLQADVNHDSAKSTETEISDLHVMACKGDKHTLKKIIKELPAGIIDDKNSLGQTALMCSIMSNQVDCAALLLQCGAFIGSSDNTGQNVLHLAINKGFHNCVKLLLSNGALWRQTDREGVTALHAAAAYCSPESLSLILKVIKPGEVDIQDSCKKTALHWSSAYANVEHTKMLLKKGANICVPDSSGKTPLHWAASSSCPQALNCLKILLKEQPSIINWQDYEGCSALHFAVSSGTIQMVDILTSKENCNIDIVDNVFTTPLHWAACQGHADKAALLLDRGAIYSCVNGCGATAMHFAAQFNQTDVMEVFLLRRYVKDIEDSDGRNSLIHAALKKSDDVIKLLAKFKFNMNYKDHFGSTALHIGAVEGHVSTTELLLRHGAKIDLEDNLGMTPFLQACERGHYTIAKVLLKNGSSLYSEDNQKRTALHWASLGGHAYLCQMLIYQGCVCNVQDNMGFTPLHYACATGKLACASVLLESKGNPNIADCWGRTPVHLAALKNRMRVMKLLLSHGGYVNSLAMLNDWVTPLDFSIRNRHRELSSFLLKRGGVTIYSIKNTAARKIQNWYRDSTSKRKSAVPILVTDENSKTFIDNGSPNVLKKGKKSTIPVTSHLFCSLEERSKMDCELFSCEKLKKKFSTAISYLYFLKNVCCICNHDIYNCVSVHIAHEIAALIIQRAWRRYSVKKKVFLMRSDVHKSFPTTKIRNYAEINWERRLASFFRKLQIPPENH